jgi:hypothetical protein
MIRFDWRRYEPLSLREDGWPQFSTSDPSDRYGEFMREPSPWRTLVARLGSRAIADTPVTPIAASRLKACALTIDLMRVLVAYLFITTIAG